MKPEEKEGFINVLAAMAEMYGKSAPSPMLTMMYFGALKNWGLEDVKSGINKHVQNTDSGQFFPKPADIIRSIEGSTGDRAEQAWTKVDRAIKRVGPHESIVFDDGLIHAVIDDMGGWVTLCEVKEDEYPYKHNEFVKRYQGFINKSPLSIPRKLKGIAEGYNQSEGQEVAPPLLIGDADKAALVYEQGTDSQRVGLVNMGDHLKNMQKRIGQ